MLLRLAVLALLLAGMVTSSFEAAALGNKVRRLELNPASITLRGANASFQIIVTAVDAEGREQDATHAAEYRVLDETIATVTQDGRVRPLANGSTTIRVQSGGMQAEVACTVSLMDQPVPLNFANQITPIFTKLGCNGGGCHGKSGGQNGYRMSLLGFEPELDYHALVKEARGRRVFPAAPEHSLLLRKGTGQMPHGGGKRLLPESEEYQLLHQWISAGMPFGSEQDPKVVAVEVHPRHRRLDRPGQQQLAVRATYSDGRVEDVTRRAQFESNDADIATASPTGLVETQRVCGEAAIMIRYQGKVAVFRASVPLPGPVPAYDYPPQTLIDPLVHRKFQQLGLVPAERCDDATFLRRVMLDLGGTLPTPAETRAFLADPAADKRDRLIDRLVETPEYGAYFANKWADLLRVKRHGVPENASGTFAFHAWLREAMQNDLPYDQFIRAIVAATGDEHAHPPVLWFKELRDFPQYVDDTAQLFLGQRLACANCHHHPFEKWSQDDYWGLAAFFSRVGRKALAQPGGQQGRGWSELRVFVRRDGQVTNKRTGKPASIKALDGADLKVPPGTDPRHLLVDWMVDPKNPFVARAIVNRYWAHFFGRGIVDPLDDLRATNPPSNEELLDALAADFVKNGWSLKHLVKTIARSRTYQLATTVNPRNRDDRQNFSRFYPRRLGAEVLLDALNQVTGTPPALPGLPSDRFAPRRALEMPDEAYTGYFLEVFGKPQRTSACECERAGEINLAQVLHLLNSDEVQQKISRDGGLADRLAALPVPPAERVTEMFLWTHARPPSPEELATALKHLEKLGPNGQKKGYQNLLWALINSKEFLFVD